MPTSSADLAKEYWLCSPGDISEKLSISFIIDLNTCQDCFVVIHDRIDFGGLDFYESKTVKPENLNGEFLWKTKKLAVQITEASAYNSKYNVSS